MTDEPLELVGWWCWQCENINYSACRSDSVPIYVPSEWARDLQEYLGPKEDD